MNTTEHYHEVQYGNLLLEIEYKLNHGELEDIWVTGFEVIDENLQDDEKISCDSLTREIQGDRDIRAKLWEHANEKPEMEYEE